MAKPNIEVGQTIWVNVRQLYIHDIKDNLQEYKVSKVNTTSVYLDRDGKLDLRLNRKDLSYRDGFLYSYQGYLDPDDYWKPIQEQKEKNELIKYINDRLQYKNVLELYKIRKYIDNGD